MRHSVALCCAKARAHRWVDGFLSCIRLHLRTFTALTLLILLAIAGTDLQAQSPAVSAPSITASEPAALVRGRKETFKLRGFELKGATQLRFPSAEQIVVELKESTDAGQAKGLENKVVGDKQLVAEVTLPADVPTGFIEYVLVTPVGEAKSKIIVLASESSIDEHEPNDGFRGAQELRVGQSVRGSIQSDKDVDVFAFPSLAGQQLRITVTSGGPLLMDLAVQCYDARGQFLAAADDGPSRDPVLTLKTKIDGPIYLCVSSSHDLGGPWHSYLMTIEEVK
ncbi:MAG: hypothetical protein ACOYKN_18390 [Pirellula sp.]